MNLIKKEAASKNSSDLNTPDKRTLLIKEGFIDENEVMSPTKHETSRRGSMVRFDETPLNNANISFK